MKNKAVEKGEGLSGTDLVPVAGTSLVNPSEIIESEDSIREFFSKLSPFERQIIRNQLKYGQISEKEWEVIRGSDYDIVLFLERCDHNEILKALALSVIDDLVSGIKATIFNILGTGTNLSPSTPLPRTGHKVLK